MVCPQCGKDAVGNATFCGNCGSTLQPQLQLNTQYGNEGNTPPPPPEYMQNPYPYTPTPTPAPVPPQPLNAQNPYPYTSAPVPPQPANIQNPYPYTPASMPQQPANMQNPYPYMPAPPQSPPKRKRGAVIAIVSVVVVLILVSSIIGFAVSKQQSTDHANATSTAAVGTAVVVAANAHATATVVAQASATAQAKANPYSPTMPTLLTVTLTGPQDITNWDSNASCTYKQGYVITTTDGQLSSCNYNSTVGSDYTAEVSVTLNNADSQGGMILRQTTNSLEILYIEKGQVTLQLFDNLKKQNVLLKNANAPITTNVSTVVAAVVDHGILKVFVNHTETLTIDDNRADITQGFSFALMDASVNNAGPSTATYSNLRLWTV